MNSINNPNSASNTVQQQQQQQQEHNNTSNTNNEGIEMQEAMSILSLRYTTKDEEKEKQKQQILKQMKKDSAAVPTMGQTIDLFEPTKTKDTMEREENNETKLKEQLSQKSPLELLQTLVQLQGERVVLYTKFNEGLMKYTNESQYIQLCTSVTAAFSILSKSIRMIQSFLPEAKEKQWIQQLQLLEQDNLQWTVAYHLDTIRLNAGSENCELLNQSRTMLKSKIQNGKKEITNVLEEIQCIIMDMKEEQE